METNKEKIETERIIEDFLESKKKMERFINEELESIKSPLGERLKRKVIEA